MNTKKILAVAAVTMLAVPALAAASQIVVPGVQEEVVEGHTVFAVIEKVRMKEEIVEAAAVAVLVREREEVKRRVKGVLWFNDQYLVAPSASDSNNIRYPCGGAVIAVNAGDPDPRTMLAAYNGTDTYQAFNDDQGTYYGSPDEQPTPYSEQDKQDVQSYDQDYGQWDSDLGVDIINEGDQPPRADEEATQPAPGSTSPSGQAQPENVWVHHQDPDGIMNNPVTGPAGSSWGTVSSSIPTALEYETSYLVTDPNDHSWIVDKYTAITVVSVDLTTGALVTTTSEFPLWVVNILGKPVFTPDDGDSSCGPFVDDPWQQGLINTAFVAGDQFACDFTVNDDIEDGSDDVPDVCPSAGPGLNNGDPNGDGIPADGLDAKPPAIGYYEPTDTDYDGDGVADAPSYCYDGNPMPMDKNGDAVPDEDTRAPGTGCSHGNTWMPAGFEDPLLGLPGDPAGSDRYNNNHPLRIYNALLYFLLGPDDVRITSADVPHSFSDTNGCQVGTEWTCPGGDDNAEGNSHPFNPPGIYVPSFTDPLGNPQGGEWYDIHAGNRDCSTGYDDVYTDPNGQPVCNVEEEHSTHNRGLVDLYFSPLARPMEPGVRFFSEYDVYGRTDVFHENNCPDAEDPADADGDGITAEPDGQCDYPNTDYHPGQPDNDTPVYPRTNYFH